MAFCKICKNSEFVRQIEKDEKIDSVNLVEYGTNL